MRRQTQDAMRDEVRAAEIKEEPPVQPLGGDHLLYVRDVWHETFLFTVTRCVLYRGIARSNGAEAHVLDAGMVAQEPQQAFERR